MNRMIYAAAFGAGLLAVGWVGFGYIGTNPLALVMTGLIGAAYLVGALELRRFQQATAGLAGALAAIPQPLPALDRWLDQLPATLRNPVRLRVEGERVGLPGPALTPYLVGLLVLLGMLGTFLGMVVTLKGAVIALESSTDLQAIRGALAAPVKGLGVAFGTSVAGVAASAMLGLLSALCRRERLHGVQLLDTRIATVLHGFSRAHQRQQTFQTLQSQAQALPGLVDRLQAMMGQMDRQQQALSAQLLAGQQDFHQHTQAHYAALASSVDASLRHSLTESARVAGATIQPVVEATMAGITRETGALHQQMARVAQQQLDGLAARFDQTIGGVAGAWTRALAEQQHGHATLTQGLQQALDGFGQTFAQRSAGLLAAVDTRQAAAQDAAAATLAGLVQETTQLQAQLAGSFEQRSATLLAHVDQAQAAVQADARSRDQQQLAALTGSLQAMAASLQAAWQQAGEASQRQQAQICNTLEQTGRDIAARSEAQARATLGELTGLMHTAAEAPRAAAEVIALLRDQLSDSLARDNQLLEERSRIMASLGQLLETVNQASHAQRGAVDALVDSSAALLDQIGRRLSDKIGAESETVAAAATQLSGSAVEVASLGEAFGFAVRLFSESNDKLMGQLQRIEGALGQSLQRSDEQLAYYVAQAREIIDLSLSSQQQIVEDLQRLASRPVLAPPVGEAA